MSFVMIVFFEGDQMTTVILMTLLAETCFVYCTMLCYFCICCHRVSVHPSVCHKLVFYQYGWTYDRANNDVRQLRNPSFLMPKYFGEISTGSPPTRAPNNLPPIFRYISEMVQDRNIVTMIG